MNLLSVDSLLSSYFLDYFYNFYYGVPNNYMQESGILNNYFRV
jgi:hypothetical protein